MTALSKAEVREAVKEGLLDPVFFCKFFLGHIFKRPIPTFHRALLALMCRQAEFLEKYGDVDWIIENFAARDAQGNVTKYLFERVNGKLTLNSSRNTLVMMHRGGAKTTICGQAIPLRKVLYGDVRFLVYISEANPHAESQLAAVKRELESNPRIISCFGTLRPSRDSGKVWNADMIETTTGVVLAAKGKGGQIRGMNQFGQRPDELLFDDVEDRESVSTPEQLKKTRVWAYSDAMPALDELEGGTMTALGTTLHPESLLEQWAKDPQWTVVRLGATDRDGAPIWVEQLSLEKLEAKRTSYAMVGELDKYYMEYFNQYRPAETQLFKPEFFKTAPRPASLRDHHISVYLDPAISERATADTSTIVVAAMSPKGQILVLETWGARTADQRLVIDRMFDCYRRWADESPSITVGIEAISFQRVLVHLMREEMFRKKLYFEVIPVTHANVPKVKPDRIKGILLPRFAAGYVALCCECPELTSQLMDFGRPGVHDDFPDALAGAVALLDPFAAAASGEVDLTKDMFPPLKEVIGGDFHAV